MLVFEGVILRLCKDLNEENEESTPRSNLIILKCFNIARTFVEQNNYLTAFFPSLEQKICPLYEFLLKNNFIFAEDILGVILTIVNKKQCIPSSMANLLPIFKSIFQMRKGILGTLFQILNGYLVFGDSVFLDNIQNIEIVLEIY